VWLDAARCGVLLLLLFGRLVASESENQSRFSSRLLTRVLMPLVSPARAAAAKENHQQIGHLLCSEMWRECQLEPGKKRNATSGTKLPQLQISL
jgi:hypothetical protein